MKENKIPKYYTDPTLSEEEKRRLDWEMIAKYFSTPTESQ